ncbi:MAG: hypothetical protein RBU21_15255 [FCB group bacterium]|jgi:hypothetical protein|nr:hypothetical protein [FCB group bacterium]
MFDLEILDMAYPHYRIGALVQEAGELQRLIDAIDQGKMRNGRQRDGIRLTRDRYEAERDGIVRHLDRLAEHLNATL